MNIATSELVEVNSKIGIIRESAQERSMRSTADTNLDIPRVSPILEIPCQFPMFDTFSFIFIKAVDEETETMFWEGLFAYQAVECRLYLRQPKWNTVENSFGFKHVPLVWKDLLDEIRALLQSLEEKSSIESLK